jgi:hypothetical protein
LGGVVCGIVESALGTTVLRGVVAGAVDGWGGGGEVEGDLLLGDIKLVWGG